jgi:lactate dehydrogenase-like 2-hydroxyacid dehydrogenase
MKIFVTRRIPQPGLSMLEKRHDLEINPENRVLTKKDIIEGVKGKDGLLCLLTDSIDKDIITAESKLRMIANYAVGYDNIDVDSATKQGIPVSNTPDVLTDTTAEMTWALIFAVARRIVESDRYTREGRFEGWNPMLLLGRDLSGKALGIIGAGRIGTAVGLKSQGFGMRILYVGRSRNDTLEQRVNATRVSLENALKESDVITLHVPLTNETFHLIGADELGLMKESAILINTSRGPAVDEQALINALEKKEIYGAGLDVYENEPDVPEKLRALNNVVLQPHSASATIETRSKMAIIAAQNMLAGLKRERPPNCVNPEVFANKRIRG